MQHSSVILQIFALLFGLGLGFVYVYPALGEVSDDQDRIAEYDNAIAEAESVNALVAELQADIDSVDPEEQERLETYLPEKIDPVRVQRDLVAYVERRNVALLSLARVETDQSQELGGERTMESFQVSVSGTYDEVKNLIADTEANAYPLHVQSLTVGGYEAGIVNADILFTTYALSVENIDII